MNRRPSGRTGRLFFVLFFLGTLFPVYGESPEIGLGTPLIRSFSLPEIGATQVPDIAQGPRGLLYFSDYDNGLLEYDGEHWRQYDLPYMSVAIEEDADGRIWTGGPSALGYMEPDERGELQYVSLLEELPEDQREFSRVWPVLPTSRGVFFMAREYLFRRHGGRFTAWSGSTEEIFYRGYEVDGRLFFAQLGVGLLELVGDQLELISGDLLAGTTEINAMFSRGDGTSWVLTRLHGVYLFDGRELKPIEVPASHWLVENQVQQGCPLPEERYAVASRRGGVAILDRDLNVLKVLDPRVGLSSYRISYVRTDHQGNLWAATDDGIDRIILDTSVVLLGPDDGLEGHVQVVERFQGRLLVGTSLGLHVGQPQPDGSLRFTSVPDLPTAVWSIIPVDDVVLLATTDGIFSARISSRGGLDLTFVRRISAEASQLIYRPPSMPDTVLVSLANGLGRLNRVDEQWNWAGRIPGFDHEIYSLVEGNEGEILAWMPSRNRLEILQFPNGPEEPATVEGFELLGLGPVRVGSSIIHSTGDGYERYVGLDRVSAQTSPFEPMPELDALADYLVMHEDRLGRLWIYGPQGIGVARETDGGLRFQPLAARPIQGFVNVFEDPEDEGTFWIGSTEGLYRWVDQGKVEPPPPSNALIRRVTLLNQDQTLYGGGGRLDELPVLPFESNNLRFEFASPIFDQLLPVEYQVRLDEFDSNWSPWSEETFKEYTNLPQGAYSFRVRALDSWGRLSTEAVFGFRILAPWYRTPWAYLGGFLLAVSLVLLGVHGRSAIEARERRRLEALIAARTEELAEGKRQVERQATALEQANRLLAEENEHRRLLEAEREKLQARMEQSQKLESLGLVAGGVAHDFNNILMAILGNADLAIEDAGTDPEVLKLRLQEIRRASHRAAELCRQMLAYAGKGAVRKDEVDLTALALDCLEIVRATAPSKIEFVLDVLENPPAIMADATQLRQVAMNLMLNAVESFDGQRIEEGSARVRILTGARHLDPDFLQSTLLADPLPPGPYVFLRVADDGAGMDETTLKKIFDPFFTTKFTGRGLGLAATLGIVHAHEGAIRTESSPDAGTAVEIFFPALDHQVDASGKSSSDGMPTWHRTGTALVVDDEEIVRDVVSVMLRNTGFDVMTAGSGDEALEIFAEHHEIITAVVMDLIMPGSDAHTTFRRMRDIDPDVRVILSSGYTGDEITERYLEAGFAGFLHKPYRAGALRETLRAILEE